MPQSWRVENGSLLARRHNGETSGDIVTLQQFDNFELTLQWKMPPGGNRGVIYRATEDRDNVWETGPKNHIGLQDYGGAIEFRSIKVRPMAGE